MEHAPECDFDPGALSHGGQQDRARSIRRTRSSAAACLRDYFLFPHVGRMDDIWAAYYLQAKGYRVVWNKASVYQQRNVHDLSRDMRQEYLGYENNLKLVQDLARTPSRSWPICPAARPGRLNSIGGTSTGRGPVAGGRAARVACLKPGLPGVPGAPRAGQVVHAQEDLPGPAMPGVNIRAPRGYPAADIRSGNHLRTSG